MKRKKNNRKVNYKIRSGDDVLVICGKDKGKRSHIQKVDRKKGRVKLININLVKKHKKANEQNKSGEIVEFAAYMDISNVMIFCFKCKKGVRIKIDRSDNKKIRRCVRCLSELSIKK